MKIQDLALEQDGILIPPFIFRRKGIRTNRLIFKGILEKIIFF